MSGTYVLKWLVHWLRNLYWSTFHWFSKSNSTQETIRDPRKAILVSHRRVEGCEVRCHDRTKSDFETEISRLLIHYFGYFSVLIRPISSLSCILGLLSHWPMNERDWPRDCLKVFLIFAKIKRHFTQYPHAASALGILLFFSEIFLSLLFSELFDRLTFLEWKVLYQTDISLRIMYSVQDPVCHRLINYFSRWIFDCLRIERDRPRSIFQCYPIGEKVPLNPISDHVILPPAIFRL
jgi:hypothetical protein